MIQTKRTIIRPIKITDEPDLFEIYNKPQVFEHYGSGVYSREQHIASVERAIERWTYPRKGELVAELDGKAIARLILFPAKTVNFELGYVLNPQFWGKGLATEIATALVEHAFSVGATQVTACARESNTASRKIIHKLEFSETYKELGDNGISKIWYALKK